MWVLTAEERATAQGLTFRILPGQRKMVGRGPLADFHIGAPFVSRCHCRLAATDDRLEVEDLGSTNGTFVNGRRIVRATLSVGDSLRVGRVEFVVSYAERVGPGERGRP